MLYTAQIDIAIVTFVMAIVSQVLQRKFYNKDEMKSKQEMMKKNQERIKELMKKEDEKSKKELESLEKEMMDSMSGMMSGSMKMMMFSLIIFVPVFWFLGQNYEKALISLPVPLPWFGGTGEPFIKLYNETNYIGWYVVCSIVFSMILNGLINVHKKITEVKK